jgi:hypothetical protein
MRLFQDNFSPAGRLVVWNLPGAIVTLQAVFLLALVGLAVGYPGASRWIAQALKAEFVDPIAPSNAST